MNNIQQEKSMKNSIVFCFLQDTSKEIGCVVSYRKIIIFRLFLLNLLGRENSGLPNRTFNNYIFAVYGIFE